MNVAVAVVPRSPSVTATSFTLTDEVSSSVIVPVAVGVPDRFAFVGPDRVTVNVSFASSVTSPRTSTVMVFEVSPGANVSVPLADV